MGLGGIMENYSRHVDQQQLELPPGFRFHPTDEELITHYLCKKVFDNKFVAIAIGDVDMNKVEPWNLPWNAKIGEDEWYFFCVRDKKYPTGMRANRATVSGYWKATGKDKEIFKGNSLVGMKKTLVFYRGRAPKGQKTNWVAHEYRLEGKSSLQNLPKSVKNEWVICRVFKKTAGGKKIHISCLGQSSSLGGNEMVPPLMDTTSPAFSGTTRSTSSIVAMPESGSHVHCFSNSINAPPPPPQKSQEDMFMFNNNTHPAPFMGVEDIFQRGPFTNTWGGPIQANTCPFSKPYSMQDNGILRDLLESYGQKDMKLQSFKTEERFSTSQETGLSTDINNEISSVVSNLDMGKNFFEDQGPPLTSDLPQGLESIWNY